MPGVHTAVFKALPNGKSSAANYHHLRRTCHLLKQVSINLGMVRLQLQVGLVGDAELNLGRVHEEIQTLRLRLEGESKPAVPSHLFQEPQQPVDQESDQTLLAECLG